MVTGSHGIEIGENIIVIFPAEVVSREVTKIEETSVDFDAELEKIEKGLNIREVRILQCICGGHIPWRLEEQKDVFCPYCGAFFELKSGSSPE